MARIDTWMELVECGASSSLAPQWTTDVRGHLTVQTLPLRHILDRFPDIRDQCQLLSLDIEGMEEHAIESLDWDATRPEVVVVEYHVQPRPEEDDMRANAIAELLARYDYAMVHRDELNVVFRRATR